MPKRTLNARINAGDVAEMARVSRSAVSRTFTVGACVSPDTRARVLAAAAALGYSPARKLRELGAAVDRPVAVIMGTMISPYFAELCERLDREIAGHGLRTIFLMCIDAAQVDAVIDEALARDVQGIIISFAAPSEAALAAAHDADVPVVLLNHSKHARGASLVWIDGPETGRAVAQMMLAEGRRSPVALATTPARSRALTAFAEAMEAGGSAKCRWIDTGWRHDDGVRAAARLHARGVQADAIFAASDELAIGFLDAVRTRQHVVVPEEMSIIGFGDTPVADWPSHRISSVRLPIVALIETAVSTLLARVEIGGAPAPRIWIGCEIVERDTTRGTTLR